MHPDLDRGGTLTRLLRELPEEGEQPYGFGEFQRRARQRARAGSGLAGGRRLAAATVIASTLIALLMRFDGLAPPGLRPQAAAGPPASANTPPPAAAPSVRAEVMERWLASLPTEPAVARMGNRAAVTGLEDRIAQLDDLLSAARAAQAQPARLAALQQQRTRLVGALVEVRYAETLADAAR
jgi:hypothetical protein